jgi:hypothetical protein
MALAGSFEIEIQALRDAAARFDEQAQAVAARAQAFGAGARVESTTFGHFGEAKEVYAAYNEGLQNVLERLKRYEDGFRRIAGNLRVTAENYERAEKASTIGG